MRAFIKRDVCLFSKGWVPCVCVCVCLQEVFVSQPGCAGSVRACLICQHGCCCNDFWYRGQKDTNALFSTVIILFFYFYFLVHSHFIRKKTPQNPKTHWISWHFCKETDTLFEGNRYELGSRFYSTTHKREPRSLKRGSLLDKPTHYITTPCPHNVERKVVVSK